MKNYKTVVTDTIDNLILDQAGLRVEENHIRRLGIGYVLATKAEAVKKAAKAKLGKLGIIPATFNEGVTKQLADTGTFILTSTTKQAARRLNEQALLAALDAERLSGPAKARIMAAAFVDAVPATSFLIEQR